MNPNVSLYQSILRISTMHPKSKALYYMNKTIYYKDLIANIDKFGQGLYEFGLKTDDCITICMPNIPECVYAFYAVNKLGCIAHMVHPLMSEDCLLEHMQQVNSKILITLDINYIKYKKIASKYPVILCSPAHSLSPMEKFVFNIINRDKLKFEYGVNIYRYNDFVKKPTDININNDANKTAVYLHSGGTSGTPKTIMLSSLALNSLVINGYDILNIKDPKNLSMFAVLPMFHGFGLCMGIHAMLYNGGIVTLMPKFHTKNTIKYIKQGKINYIIGIPILYEALLKNKNFKGKSLKNIKMAFVGGDFVSQDLLDRFNAHMENNGSKGRLYEGYGLTETVTVCCVNNDIFCKKSSVGKMLSNLDGKILNPDENGYGELCVSGDVLMNGYLNDEQQTNDAFINIDGKKYVKTGDLCKIDNQGFVFFKSRIKRIVKVNGINVYPSEIENFVASLIKVNELMAIDVADEKHGNVIVLFIKGKQNDDLEQQLKEQIKNKLSIYSMPKRIIFMSSLPKTDVGKIDGKALLAMYNEGKF